MAAITGSTGSVTFASGYTSNCFRWEANLVAEALETTPFAGDSGYKTRKAGLLSWTGSYECYIDDTTTPPVAGVSGSATLVANTGRQYGGAVLITGVRLGVSADGSRRTAEFTFRGTGVPTPA